MRVRDGAGGLLFQPRTVDGTQHASDRDPALTLIMATRGRTEPIANFLKSLDQQDRKDGVELLIVDQNGDDRVEKLIAQWSDRIAIRHMRTQPGLSFARNRGAEIARGKVFGFPDDDCWYPPHLLREVLNWFDQNPDAHGLSCRVCDETGKGSAGGFMGHAAHWVTRGNIWRSVTSPGLFVRRSVQAMTGGFDELLGLGAASPWGSAEESDYVLRAIAQGGRVFYQPELMVYHARKRELLQSDVITRGWSYGQGAGYVLAKNEYRLPAVLYYASLPIASSGLALISGQPGKCVARLAMCAGRISGWCRAQRRLRTSGSPVAAVAANDMLPGDAASAPAK